jgi:hypothetical protein
MRAVIVYESMFGSTRAVAEAVAQGIAECADVSVLGVAEADPSVLDGADLLVVGAPTHVHGMSRPSTRKAAREQADKPGSRVVLEPGADSGPGVREWLASLGRLHLAGAAFDTRLKGPAVITGRASKAIRRSLSHHGVQVVAHPESFRVDTSGELLAGETARARAWGARLTWADCLKGTVEHRRATT